MLTSISSIAPNASIVTDKQQSKISALPLFTRARSSCKNRTSRKRSTVKSKSHLSQPCDTSNIITEEIGPFWFESPRTLIIDNQMTHAGMTRKELLQLKALISNGSITQDFLNNILIPLNDESSDLPRLRAFNWAVTNYAKGHPAMTSTLVDLSVSYNQQLRKLHRSLFDPYRRGTFLYFYGPPKANTDTNEPSEPSEPSVHYTTVGQLTFVSWCVENGVDKYVSKNEAAIRDHMNRALKCRRKEATVASAAVESSVSSSVSTPDLLSVKRTRTRELTYAPSKYFRGAVAGNIRL